MKIRRNKNLHSDELIRIKGATIHLIFAESIILMANASSTNNSISIAYNILCKQVVPKYSEYCAFNLLYTWKGFLFVKIIFYRWRSVHVYFMSENNVGTKHLYHHNLENWFSCRILYLNEFKGFMWTCII